MFEKKDLETFLRINGVSATAPDEEIRSVLLEARYCKANEVDTVITVLRENSKTHVTRVDGLHKVFRSDDGLNSQEIASLLGIDLRIDEVNLQNKHHQSLSARQTTLIIILAIILALLGVYSAMYVYQVGVFHPTSTAFGK